MFLLRPVFAYSQFARPQLSSSVKLKSRPKSFTLADDRLSPPLGLHAAAFDLEKVSLIKLK